jgi:hypothetical protein
MRIEEIVISTLPSDLAEEQRPEARLSDAALEQCDRFRFRSFAFELFNQRLLSVHAEDVFRHARDYELDIGILDPVPKRSLTISWYYLSAFLVLTATAGVTGLTNLVQTSAMLPAILGSGAGLSLMLAVYRSHDCLVFYSRNGRVPLVVLLNRTPDRETFTTFTDVLTRHIQETRDDHISSNQTLSTELKEHRRLMEEGIISEKRYAIVKRRILGLYQ